MIGVKVVKIVFGELDVVGCCKFELVVGSEYVLFVDVVIMVFGF